MADLIRVGIELDASGVRKGVTEAQTQFTKLTGASQRLQFDLDRLRQRAPAIARGFTQIGFAAQNMAFAAGSGVGALRSLQSGLFALTVGSPAIMAAIAGFTIVVSWLERIRDKSERANEAMLRIGSRQAAAVGGATTEVLQRRLGEIRASAAARGALPGLPSFTSEERRLEGLILRELERRQREEGTERAGGGGREPAKRRRGDVSLGGAFSPTTLDLTSKNMDKVRTSTEAATEAALNLGKAFEDIKTPTMALTDGLAAGFGEMIDALANGGNAGKAFFGGLLRELSRYAKTQAVIQLAEGFASLFKNPAAAAAHFRSAALFGTGAALAGAAAGGGGGGGAGGAFGRGPVDRARDPDGQRVVVIQIVGQRTSEVISQTVAGINREQNLGGAGVSRQVVRVPVEGVMVARV